MLIFKGIQKTTLIDFPGKVACTLFLPKCNFRCPFCYNPGLVLDKDTGLELSEKEALAFLDGRKGFLDGVCITGGEPLLHKGLLPFLKKVKEKGLLVKLDTNGSKPDLLKKLLQEKFLDYVAMDIKASPENYEKAAGTKVDLQAIKESIALIKASSPDYEFRMTIVPGIHSKKEMAKVGKLVEGAKKFFLQQFNPKVGLLDKEFEKKKTFTKQELQEFAAILKPFVEQAELRCL